jgi:psp operon transcriptional activator
MVIYAEFSIFDRMSMNPPPIIGESPAWLDAMDRVSSAAPLDRPVLVIGERGSGKELVAARLHFLSRRWSQPYLKLNCAALSEQLLESELFGHEAGAFTGAIKRHVGRFERADGGTLFLDEIATASDRVQEKLLRVIEYGEFERVGGDRTLKVDVRIVAATNMDLPTAAAAGRFRADLLDRLAFDVLTLPPLRARPDDIAVLADHFGRAMAHEIGIRFAGFGPEAQVALALHAWPGNVRELKNTVERAVHRAASREDQRGKPIGRIDLDPFASPWRPATPEATAGAPEMPAPAPAPEPGRSFTAQVMAFERALVTGALDSESGHQGRAAERLGLTYDQLRGLLKKHDIRVRRAASG